MFDEREALERRIENLEEGIRLIEERESEYTLSTDVPLDLIRRKREQQDALKELKRRLESAPSERAPARRALTEEDRGQITLALLKTGCLEDSAACKAVAGKLPFAAGVDCDARLHMRTRSLLDACLEHPRGLEELVEALASSFEDEGTAAACLSPLHETLQKLLPQPVGWAQVTEGKALLNALSSVGHERLEAYYRASCPEGARLPGATHAGRGALLPMLDSLAKMACRAPDTAPFLEFILRLSESVGGPTAGRLSDYAAGVAAELGFDLATLREKVARRGAARAGEETSVCLMIKVTPSAWQPEGQDEPSRFLANAWVNYAGSFEPLPEKDGEHALESLPALIEQFVTECHLHVIAHSRSWNRAGYMLTVEAFLPLGLLDCDIDQWKIKAGKQPRPVGTRYQLVVRSWDRLYDPDYWTTWDIWTRKWIARPRPPLRATEERHVLVASCDEDYSDKLVFRLEQRGTVFMPLSAMPPSRRAGGATEVFWPMLDSGTPIALWLRREDDDLAATREELCRLVCGEDLNALPRLVHERRLEAQTGEIPRRLWDAVTLLWDDPEKLPPDITSGKFETPKERVTNP